MKRIFLFSLFVMLATAAMACPSCKDALGNTPQTAGLAKGFYITILLMLGAIFGMVGLLVFKIVREARNETA